MSIAAIVPAAGRSTRMGRAKALLELDGRSFLAGIVAKLRFAGITPVVVVVARPDADIAAEAARAGARVAFNPDPERGMLSSILAGLDLLEGSGAEALLLWPVDHPAVHDATVMALKLGWEKTRAPLIVPEHQGRRGHPVLIARSLFGELRRAAPEEGARALFAAHEAELARVEVSDPGIRIDVDTPEDYRRLVPERRGEGGAGRA